MNRVIIYRFMTHFSVSSAALIVLVCLLTIRNSVSSIFDNKTF